MRSSPIVLAITGASGVIYGRRLLEVLLQHEIEIHLTISESGRLVMEHELGVAFDGERVSIEEIFADGDANLNGLEDQLVVHPYNDFMSPIASGSFLTRAMIVCPCSGSTLSGIANATSRNLIERAADVHLKERRPLILVPRETPLSLIQIENMRAVAAAGATILPASPGFYHGCQTIADLVDFVVARILDHVGVEHSLMKRWGQEADS